VWRGVPTGPQGLHRPTIFWKLRASLALFSVEPQNFLACPVSMQILIRDFFLDDITFLLTSFNANPIDEY
jgi:hypothetical protein